MKTLIISDLHLGAKYNNSALALKLLKKEKFNRLILNGDIIDGWRIKKYGFNYWGRNESEIVRKILSLSKKIEVVYIVGNHDDFLLNYLGDVGFKVVEEYSFDGFLFIHGDKLDVATLTGNWICKIGANLYDALIFFNNMFKLFFPRFSLSKFLKTRTKKILNFLGNFEKAAVVEAKKKNCHTVVCGHVHFQQDKIIDGVRYVNSGDFQEGSGFAVIEKGVITLGRLT